MGGGMTERLQMVDWNGTVLWDYTYSNSSYNLHHDFCPLPNGNILAIAYEAKTAAEVTTAGCNISHVMWPDKIVEFQPTGTNSATIVWEWHAWDHLVQDYDASKNNYGVVADHPELLDINYNNTSNVKDWMHMNGIDYNPILDQIAFSCHNLDQIFVIDHSTTTAEAASHSGGISGKGGDILYRWGDPAHYDTPGTAILNVVHDAHWIPEGYPNAGYLVGFNNNGVSQNQSSVDLVSPPLNGFNYDWTPGSAFSPSSYTLRQTCNGHSNNMGNSEQFPNGNMMVCTAQSGTVYEINSTGTQLWTYTANGTINAPNDSGVDELGSNSLRIYPNPAKEELVVVFENQGLQELTIRNLLGISVLETRVSSGQSLLLTGLNPGVYFLNLGGEIRKLVKE